MTAPAALPNDLPRPPEELARLQAVWRPPRGLRFVTAVNNSQLGLLYIGTTLVFFIAAGVLGLVIRAQLSVPEGALVSAATYNQIFTMHGTVMMFLFAVPVVEAIAVFLLPAMIGARDLPFPRLSAYAYWAYCAGGIAFFATLFFGVAPDGGWFMYPPLTSTAYSPGPGADWWLLGIGFIEISAIAGAIELVVGVLFTRAPGMTLAKMPMFAWAMLIVGLMIVFAFPAIIAGTALLELERAFDWPFFIAERGGDPLLWQHLFWFFGHPEVYIISLPAAGLVSMMVPVMARRALIGYRAIVAGLIGVGVMSFGVWLHHMFTAGFGPFARTLVSGVSLAIAIPTALQFFAWLGTLAKGRLVITTASRFVLGFLVIFALGGLTGVMLAVPAFNAQVHDTYFIVAHLHYVLIGGLVFPMMAALYFWTPLTNGHPFCERIGRWGFWLMFIGFNVAFFPMHIAGIEGMPRRVASYPAGVGLELWNLIASIGAFTFAAGVALIAFDAIRTWRKPEQPHSNPWNAGTLEWIPSEAFATRSIPQVDSRDPLWARPSLAAEVTAGAHWLPGTVLGRRESIVTTPVSARPHHLIVLTGDSAWPFVAGLATAGFFLLLTVKWMIAAWLCGALAIIAIWIWLWETDRAPPMARVPIGRDVSVPVGARGRWSHSWWGTLILVIVDASVFASLAFAHIQLASRADRCPPAGAALPHDSILAFGVIASAIALFAAIYGVTRTQFHSRGARAQQVALWILVVGALGAFAAAALMLHQSAGLSAARDAWSATVAALLGYQLLHAIVVAGMGAYLVARVASGALTPASRATLDNVALFTYGAVAQAITGIALVQLLPRWLG